MSEKRFSYGRKNDMNFGYCPHCIRDLQEDKIFTDYTEIADLLNQLNDENEQLQNTINAQKNVIDEYIENIIAISKENEQLKKEKENLIKMVTNGIRISYTGYIQLEKENEQLRKELNCFKPVMFQDMRKGTVILYSKGDISEL